MRNTIIYNIWASRCVCLYSSLNIISSRVFGVIMQMLYFLWGFFICQILDHCIRSNTHFIQRTMVHHAVRASYMHSAPCLWDIVDIPLDGSNLLPSTLVIDLHSKYVCPCLLHLEHCNATAQRDTLSGSQMMTYSVHCVFGYTLSIWQTTGQASLGLFKFSKSYLEHQNGLWLQRDMHANMNGKIWAHAQPFQAHPNDRARDALYWAIDISSRAQEICVHRRSKTFRTRI